MNPTLKEHLPLYNMEQTGCINVEIRQTLNFCFSNGFATVDMCVLRERENVLVILLGSSKMSVLGFRMGEI